MDYNVQVIRTEQLALILATHKELQSGRQVPQGSVASTAEQGSAAAAGARFPLSRGAMPEGSLGDFRLL